MIVIGRVTLDSIQPPSSTLILPSQQASTKNNANLEPKPLLFLFGNLKLRESQNKKKQGGKLRLRAIVGGNRPPLESREEIPPTLMPPNYIVIRGNG